MADDDAGWLGQPLCFGGAGRVWTPATVRFHTKTMLRATTAAVFGVLLAVTIVLAVNHAYNMAMFTLWSFTLATAFSLVLLVTLWVQHLLLTHTLLFFLPLVLTNVVFVVFAIVIIIANNSTVYTNNTPCADPPDPNPKYTVSQLHTGDWVEHGLPVFGLMLILLAGGLTLMRFVLRRALDSWSPLLQWAYFAFWMLASLVLLGIYSLAFDVADTYPTSFSTAESALIAVGIIFVWQLFTWLVFTSITVSDDIHISLPATPAEFLATGHLTSTRGGQQPSATHALLVPTAEQLLLRL